MTDTHYEDAWREGDDQATAPLVDAVQQAHANDVAREQEEFERAYRGEDAADAEPKADDKPAEKKGDEERAE